MRLFDDDGLYVGPEDDTEPACPICHSGLYWEDCGQCDGEGKHELYGEDPFYYDHGDTEDCDRCDGHGGWYRCLSQHAGRRTWYPNELPKD